MLIKRTPADVAFSSAIREAANFVCARCGQQYRNRAAGLHAAHIVGRAKKVLRYYPLNAFPLCMGCHTYFTAHPLLFGEFVDEKRGRVTRKLLVRLSNTTIPFRVPLKKIAEYYTKQAFDMFRYRLDTGLMGTFTVPCLYDIEELIYPVKMELLKEGL